MNKPFHGIFDGLTVLVTGHTGFKGSWLTLWLKELGAHVIGYSLEAPTNPSNFQSTGLESEIVHIVGDIRDYESLKNAMSSHRPDVVFHLAAQPIVLHSYERSKETFDVNAGGTVNVLEAARCCPSIKAMVMVTTDKCYENNEWIWGYRENDRLGGKDPYSASKSMAELAVASYNASFFQDGPFVATARAGNVIGGGDFSDLRILPDCVKALMQRKPIAVRNPHSVRPWLNVLDPLSGYLWLATRLLEQGSAYTGAWNFGPLENEAVSVKALVEQAIALWGNGEWVDTSDPQAKAEMALLRLNWDKAANILKWRPTYGWREAVSETIEWFQEFHAQQQNPSKVSMREIGVCHIRQYIEKATSLNLPWASEMLTTETQEIRLCDLQRRH